MNDDTPADTRVAIDLRFWHTRRTFGPITCYATWFGRAHLPCLVLIPTAHIGHEHATPCVIPVTAAWAWAEETGDPVHAARTSAQFASIMGFSSINDALRITSIVRECMGDLLTIPPKPVEREVVADAIITDQHGRQRHTEIMDDVAR